MEKWKIAIISALCLSLLGFGIWQQINDTKHVNDPISAPAATAVPSPLLGKTLPPWNFKTWNSKPIATAQLQGAPSLVEIFRTECPHCQDAAPFMVAIEKRYGPRGLKIVGIQSPGDYKNAENPETKWGDVTSWLKEKHIDYPVAFDQNSAYFQGTLKKQLLNDDPKNLSYPTMVVADKTGKIVFSHTGHDVPRAISLAVELEKLFPTSADVSKNATDLTAWLKANLMELAQQLEGNPEMQKSLSDDLAQRLKGNIE